MGEHAASASAREREAFRFLEPWRSTAAATRLFDPISLQHRQETARKTTGCADTALAAFAQLGAYRFRADRCLVTLFSQEHEFILAESTRSLSLQSDATKGATDALWIGTASYNKAEGFSASVLPHWNTTCEPRPQVSDLDHYHTEQQTPHFLIVSDLRNDPKYASILPQFNSRIRFLCSVPLRSLRGHVIGSYTVIDSTPRYGVSEDDMVFLEDMSETVVNHLESRRAILHKRNAERLIKGLGIFSQGGASMRDWWLESLTAQHQRSRRLDQASAADGPTRDQQADEELGDTYLQADQPSWRRQSDTPSHQQPRPDSAKLNRTDIQDFASDPTSGAKGRPRTVSPSAGPSSLMDLSRSTSEVFARASNLIREAMNVDGVVFLDAGFTTGKASRSGNARRLSIDGSVLDHVQGWLSSSGSSASERLTDSSRDDGGSPTTGKRRRRHGVSSAFCEPLGYSTRTGSSMRNFTFPKKFSTLPQKHMEKLIRRYPEGKLLNFSDNGTIDSSSGHEGNGSRAELEAAMSGQSSTSQQSIAKRADAICKLCDDARTVAFIPVWDSHREKWRAGFLVWVTTPGRHFTREEDLAYLSSFAHNVSGELLRLDMLASDQAKATFISMMSHELRSPLHGVLAGAEYLLETELDQMQYEMTTTVKSAGSALLETINAILDYTKINTTAANIKGAKKNMENLPGRYNADDSPNNDTCADLAVLTENVLNTVVAGQCYRASTEASERRSSSNVLSADQAATQSGDVQVILDISHNTNWRQRIDSGSWIRILTNLVTNSLKYTKEGYVHIRLQIIENVIRLAIQDTGRGISRDYQQNHMYTAFKQEDALASGTGLGLYMVKQLVTQMDGEIRIESDASRARGTKILIKFPCADGDTRQITDGNVSPIDNDVSPSHVNLVMLRAYHSDVQGGIHTRDEMTRTNIRRTCQEWFNNHVSMVDKLELANSDDVCIMLQSEFLDWVKTRPNHDTTEPPCRLIVLKSRFGESLQKDVPLPAHFTLEPPFGPRKLARVLNNAADPRHKGNKGVDVSQSPQLAHHFRPVTPRLLSNDSFASTPGSPNQGCTKKFLLVEDNDLNMKLLIAWSRKLGVQYVTAVNGLEAVTAYCADPHAFGVILTDISMPVMDGFTATREIRQYEKKNKLKRCRVVAITGVASEDARNDATKAGIDDFCVKPASMTKLRQLLKDMIDDE